MEKIDVKVVSEGVAIGKIRYYNDVKLNINRFEIEDVSTEIARFNNARIRAKEELKEIYKEAVNSVGKEMAEIFEVCQLILLDEEYVNKIKDKITTENVNSEYAIYLVSEEFSERLKNSDDIYLSDRATDIKDVSNRMIRILNERENYVDDHRGEIVIFDEVTPSEILRVSKSEGIITKVSSGMSHASIMSRNMGLVHVSGISSLEKFAGKIAIVDAYKGVLYIEPDEAILKYYSELGESEQEMIKDILSTSSGKTIKVMANVNSYEEAKIAKENYSDGIGLFRTEFIYMNSDKLPTEDEQYNIYRDVLELFDGKPVIIRTLDTGADKRINYLDYSGENNPALGLRGIRYSMNNKDILLTQIKAVYRASLYGDVRLMFPMITSVEEIGFIKNIISEVKKELDSENIEYNAVKLGIMIETPAAAMLSDVLAKEVNFFSIGTNDLTQYSLAVDRDNALVAEFYNPYHEGILRLIKLTIKNAHNENCEVSICGELAADINMTERLCEMGMDSLSVAPVMVQKIKKNIRKNE
ncbi:MAG: phosphoenolpyruvate--protein phosphotransferase [Lachnospiraceae bacterium]|nr:phosphoenolpyruvate--protein phosphotransferase [Lachnospiraceae bacterium]